MDKNAITGGDDRLVRDSAQSTRGDRSAADAERTQKDGTVFSKPEQRRNFRNEWAANALPNPPGIPGFHLVWLSTTNSADPIHKRLSMGYELVKAEEVPGFEHYKMKSGEYVGCVAVNEMVLAKVDAGLYQEIMAYFHHEQPLAEEEMLKDKSELQDANVRSVEEAQGEADGFGTLALGRNAPVFD